LCFFSPLKNARRTKSQGSADSADLRILWNLSREVPPRGTRKVAVTEADSISGCCHAVIRFPSHFRSPHPSPRYPWSVHPFLFRSLSLAVSRPRSSRASNERRCLKAHTGVRQADKFTRDARVGSRAVRTSVHVARGADITSGGERSTQRALSLSWKMRARSFLSKNRRSRNQLLTIS